MYDTTTTLENYVLCLKCFEYSEGKNSICFKCRGLGIILSDALLKHDAVKKQPTKIKRSLSQKRCKKCRGYFSFTGEYLNSICVGCRQNIGRCQEPDCRKKIDGVFNRLRCVDCAKKRRAIIDEAKRHTKIVKNRESVGCKDCGARIKDHHSKRRFCDKCLEKKRKVSYEKSNKKRNAKRRSKRKKEKREKANINVQDKKK